MERLTSKIEYLMAKHPHKVVEFAKSVYKQNPEMVEEMLETFEDEGHITSERKYKELTERLKWANNQGKGEKWKIDEIKRYSKMNFENEEFTEWDFAYLVNMLYAKCCREFSDISYYIKIAKCLLEDKDEETKMYRGAEHPKHKYKKYGSQSYYDNYDNYDEEESRRHRRYRSENDYRNEDYRNEDYRRYRSESNDYDSRYRDNNVGFR